MRLREVNHLELGIWKETKFKMQKFNSLYLTGCFYFIRSEILICNNLHFSIVLWIVQIVIKLFSVVLKYFLATRSQQVCFKYLLCDNAHEIVYKKAFQWQKVKLQGMFSLI